MVSCDTHVLFAASNPDDAKHAEARAFIEAHVDDSNFARRRIHDVRLAETLKYWGVDEFHTRNTRDFADLGFRILNNPFD